MILQIPDQIAQQIPMNEEELLLEFSIFLYEQEILSMRAAATMAGVSWVKMEKLLAERGIDMHYDMEDVNKDLENLKKLN